MTTIKTVQENIYPLLRKGYAVTFCPIDCLNPQVGMHCIIEGSFGKVSGDSVDSIPLAFYNAVSNLGAALDGYPSNRQPVLSLNQQVAAMTDSQLVDLASYIHKVQLERWKDQYLEIKPIDPSDCL